jgi:hypothetical protein
LQPPVGVILITLKVNIGNTYSFIFINLNVQSYTVRKGRVILPADIDTLVLKNPFSTKYPADNVPGVIDGVIRYDAAGSEPDLFFNFLQFRSF